jgi:hypothetical protein
MRAKKDRRLRKILNDCCYTPHAGSAEFGGVDGAWQPVKEYIQYPKNSNMQKYLKRQSNRKVRRSEAFPNGNSYRKCMEYRWRFY